MSQKGRNIQKIYKAPEKYDARIIEAMFQEIYSLAASKILTATSGKPDDSVGFNREMRVDESTNKVYVKFNGAWKEETYT